MQEWRVHERLQDLESLHQIVDEHRFYVTSTHEIDFICAESNNQVMNIADSTYAFKYLASGRFVSLYGMPTYTVTVAKLRPGNKCQTNSIKLTGALIQLLQIFARPKSNVNKMTC